jgi:miniconductance mechanosensitive channel
MEADWIETLRSHPLAGPALGIALLVVACWLAQWLTRRVLVVLIERLILRSQTDWDDVLHEQKVLERLAGVVPAVVAWYGIAWVPGIGETAEAVVGRVAFAAILVVISRSLLALVTAVNEIYSRDPENASRPIKGYIQVVQILVSIITAVLVLATLLDRSPLIFLSGLGAMTAVILLIFRDTILSLVASVQITGNDMVRVGDWIEMPQYGADGDVIDVALHTVKVQNWDKTITTIPTHKLIADSFKNWRFMTLSGGRRIKRAVHVDLASVRFLGDAETERFAGSALLGEYLRERREAIEADLARGDRDPTVDPDVRRLTNLGTFRIYMDRYLRAHPQIHLGMTLMVRQLASGENGVPLEVYCFTRTTDWDEYEGIQADLFDHFMAIAPQFGLRLFQNPTGADFARLAGDAG